MNKELDIRVAKTVQVLIEEHKLTRAIVSSFLKIRPTSFGDIMNGKSPWRLDYLSKVALYFNKTTDELIFGDKDFVSKFTKQKNYEFKEDIQEYLIREKKYETFGKLTADGFFSEIKPKSK